MCLTLFFRDHVNPRQGARSRSNRKTNPTTEDALWALSQGWDVKYQYLNSSKQLKWKKLGTVTNMHFSKQGYVGFRTNLVVLKISTSSQEKEAPLYIFQVAKLDVTQLLSSTTLDEKAINKLRKVLELEDLGKTARIL